LYIWLCECEQVRQLIIFAHGRLTLPATSLLSLACIAPTPSPSIPCSFVASESRQHHNTLLSRCHHPNVRFD
jgi:hypothetical protein